MSESKLLPVGIQDFEKLLAMNCIYVDKTQIIYEMIRTGTSYFLARPRRFGKSLMLSVIENIFRGHRDLFKGLWIADSQYSWPIHPVIKIDMSETVRSSVLLFNDSLNEILKNIAQSYRLEIDSVGESSLVLRRLVMALAQTHGKVVVLIDEYDKPMLDHIQDQALCRIMQNKLRDFYEVLKARDQDLRFVILTGVTRFSKISVFSGLNNLTDLSLDTHYSTLLGYTHHELLSYFEPFIENLILQYSTSKAILLEKIKLWYDGYLFAPVGERVYNPYSVMMLFKQNFFRAHWFSTGAPKFLIDLMKERSLAVAELDELIVSEQSLTTTYDIDRVNTVSLLYQAGYLTIKDFDSNRLSYRLAYPNFEVEQAITESLLFSYTAIPEEKQHSIVIALVKCLEKRHYEELFNLLKHYLSTIPYDLHLPFEKYYQTIVYLIFTLVGIELQVEVHTNRGRIDAVLEFEDHILIFEFKLDKTLEAAFYQMQDKNYPEKYLSKKKKITLFAVNFSVDQRNIESWASQELL